MNPGVYGFPMGPVNNSSAPVGSFLFAPYKISDPAYLLCNGAKLVRTTYPLYAALQPVGTFTSTIRTKGAVASSAAVYADSTNFIAAGAPGTSAIQTSPDGITWTQRTTAAYTSYGIKCIAGDGTNIVILTSAAAGIAPSYSTDNGATFTQSTSGGAFVADQSPPSALTYAPNLGTVGRFLALCQANGLYISTSDDRGVTWTSYAHGTGFNFLAVCWTGTKFIALTSISGTVMTSTTGLTGSWTAQAVSFIQTFTAAGQGQIVSDGAGKVLIIDNSAFVATVSTDNLATTYSRSFATLLSTGNTPGNMYLGVPSFANGRFFILWTAGQQRSLLVSTDLNTWLYPPDVSLPAIEQYGIAFKAGVYLASSLGSQNAFSFVEDTTKVYLPLGVQNIAQYGSNNNYNTFVKVK